MSVNYITLKRCSKSCWGTVSGYIVSFGGLFEISINIGETIIPSMEDKKKLLDICS